MASHPLLKSFQTAKPAFGAWITLPGALNARTAALASPHLSWLLIDCEHGITSLHPGALETVQAVAGLGPTAPSTIVRIPATGACADGSAAWQIKYVLDSGARGVLVPMVSTAAQAKSVVTAARFPPQGIRGFGSPFTHTAWGVSAGEYLANANENVLVIVQIETVEGVQNLDEILAVDSLDAIFIGPFDLSLAHGYAPPSPDPHPDIEVIIQDILRKAHAKGKKCAIYCTSGPQSARRAKEGFDMINVTSDSAALADGLTQHLAAAAGEEVGAKGFGY